MLMNENLDEYKKLLNEIREVSLKENGFVPIIVMQATNSGRYSKPNGYPEPLIAYHCAPLEDTPLPEERVVTDDVLKRYEEAYSMIHSLRAYKIIKGTRGQAGINEARFAEVIVRLSTLLRFATEIKEMDINPLLADENGVVAVDARIYVEPSK